MFPDCIIIKTNQPTNQNTKPNQIKDAATNVEESADGARNYAILIMRRGCDDRTGLADVTGFLRQSPVGPMAIGRNPHYVTGHPYR